MLDPVPSFSASADDAPVRASPAGRVVLYSARAPRPEHLPGGARVLTPGRRAAAALGVPFASLSGEAFRDVLASGLQVATPLRSWRALGEAVERALPQLEAGPWRRALAGPVRELLRGEALDVAVGEVLSLAARRALAVARAYRDALAAEDAIDAAEAYTVAARVGGAPRDRPWAVVGTWQLDRGATRYLDAVAGAGSVVLLPPEAEFVGRRLIEAGWEERHDPVPPERVGETWAHRFLTGDAAPVPAAGAPRAEPGSDARARAVRFRSQDEEVRWVLASVGRLLAAGTPPDAMLIVARDPGAIAPRLEATAWELGVPVRVARDRPLGATAVGGFVTSLLEVVARDAPYEETLRLLRHRLSGGLSRETLARARVERPEGVAAWTELDPRGRSLDWPRRAERQAFGRRLEASLADLGLLREEVPDHDELAVRMVLRGVAEACEPAAQTVDRRTFLADVAELLALLSLRPDAGVDDEGSAAVEVAGPLAVAGATVERLFVIGAVEGVLPADVRDDAMLDFADRAALAAAGADVDGAVQRAGAEEAAFAQLLRAVSGEMTVGVPSRAGGASLLASPYLARLGLDLVAAPKRAPWSPEERRRARLASERDEDDPVLASARRAWRVEKVREGADPPGRYDGVTGRPRDADRWTFSATSLTDIGQCPFRWFGRHLLRLREPDEADEVITPRLRGILWHGTLERAVAAALERLRREGRIDTEGGPVGDGPAAGQEATEALRRATSEALEDAFEAAEVEERVPMTRAWRRVRGGELRALERLVRAEAFVRPGWLPVAVETRFEGTWRGLSVRGTVDRVDAGPGGAELIDYKSGGSRPKGVQREAGRGWLDVQLPLYLEAAAPQVAPFRPATSARYLSVRAAATLATVEPDGDAAELDAFVARVRSHLAAGAYPVAPDVRREVCRTCDLASVCRVGPRIERKRDAAPVRAGDP